MEWSEGDLVWFDPSIGHPLPGEIQEVHRAAQVTIVQAMINGKVSHFSFLVFFYKWYFDYKHLHTFEKIGIVLQLKTKNNIFETQFFFCYNI